MKSCGADLREIARWSHSSDLAGRELNFDTELEYLRDWWTRHIAFLDNNVFIPYPMGDVNFDHEVDILDVTILIDHLLYPQDRIINEVRADYDKNGEINISDVTHIIDTILSQH